LAFGLQIAKYGYPVISEVIWKVLAPRVEAPVGLLISCGVLIDYVDGMLVGKILENGPPASQLNAILRQ
jgi:hypothetical protein